MSKKAASNLQYAALPYRRSADGTIEIMLITSLNTKRWIIPKGWPAQGLTPRDCAAREALEESGLVGRISDRSIGFYWYEKRLADGSTARCMVETYALAVEKQLTSWPERDRRLTKWHALQAAADAVQEPELRTMIQSLAALLS